MLNLDKREYKTQMLYNLQKDNYMITLTEQKAIEMSLLASH